MGIVSGQHTIIFLKIIDMTYVHDIARIMIINERYLILFNKNRRKFS